MIYLSSDDRQVRAATGVAAAIERFLGWLLLGPRQHRCDRAAVASVCHPGVHGESTGEGASC